MIIRKNNNSNEYKVMGGEGMMLKSKWLYIVVFVLVLVACSEETTKEVKDEASTEDRGSNPPSTDELDPDDPMTPFVEQGEDIFNDTNSMLAEEAGNELSCMSCHADGGLSENSSMVGVTKAYPKYQPREGTVLTLEERINSCMIRSMDGDKLDYDGEEMRSIVAYLTYISEGTSTIEDVNLDEEENAIEEIPEPSVDNGEELYAEKNCLSCHATDGSGTGASSGPALWGDHSFNDGASMSRIHVMADYIKNNMPPDDAEQLDDQEAADLAAFLLSQERPVWEGHDKDWPDGDRPNDIITKDKRKEMREGTFDWSQVSN